METTNKKETLSDIVIKNYYDVAFINLQKARNKIENNLDLSKDFDEYNYAKEKLEIIQKAINMFLDL